MLSFVQPERLVTFPAASPGFVHLESAEALPGNLELSFLFKTGGLRGMLFYLQDANEFYYISLSLVKGGAIELRVFPQYEINTSTGEGGKSTVYNDNKWHTVTVVITQSMIQLHTDDHDYFK
jgi:hypothetical protein